MKMTIENYGKTHTTDFGHDDINIIEYIDTFYALLIAVSFCEETIVSGFKEFIESKEL